MSHDTPYSEANQIGERQYSLQNFTPTAKNINALPIQLRNWIMELETNADPSGNLRRTVVAEENVKVLGNKVISLREALQKIIEAWNNPNLDSGETAAEMATIAQQALNQ